MKWLLAILFIGLSTGLLSQPKVSFTFDDGSINDRPGYSFEEWNQMLLKKLDQAEIKATFFVTGRNKTKGKGADLLKEWDQRGHQIANHTLTHPNYNSDNNNFEDFKSDFLANDAIIKQYKNYTKLFRFPYLKEGNTPEKVSKFRELMELHDYRNGYVTIDASDWYIDSRMIEQLKSNPEADLSNYKKYYLEHLWERANFYEKLSFEITGRNVNHTLLLHHNLAAALFLDDLVKMFRDNGWEVISSHKAYQDPIFKNTPMYAGESLIWALAKDSGLYEDLLRYPAEDSRYEKDKMDKWGL